MDCSTSVGTTPNMAILGDTRCNIILVTVILLWTNAGNGAKCVTMTGNLTKCDIMLVMVLFFCDRGSVTTLYVYQFPLCPRCVRKIQRWG